MSSARGIVLGTIFVLVVIAIAGVVTLDFYLRQSSAEPAVLRPTPAAGPKPTLRPILEPPAAPTQIVIPIRLPPTAVTAPPTPTGVAEGTKKQQEVYVVQPGDTVSAIAARFEVSVEALASENGLADPSFIKVGQELLIPAD